MIIRSAVPASGCALVLRILVLRERNAIIPGRFRRTQRKSPIESGSFVDKMVARDGIEPPTRGFSIPCSTN
jgi:hypothetical protein